MNWSALCTVAQELVAVIDTGKYNSFPFSKLYDAIQTGMVLRCLRETTGTDIDLSAVLDVETYPNFEAEYEAGLQALFGGYAGREREKWGVEHSGLCLLLTWTIELLKQQARDAQSYEYEPGK
ncbi:MAG: hypothetical protein WAL92_04010 [Thiogranum sp.]